MESEQLPEPWYSFLSDIDRAATSQIVMHCIGGFAVSLYYGLARPTGDIDVVDVTPDPQIAPQPKRLSGGSMSEPLRRSR